MPEACLPNDTKDFLNMSTKLTNQNAHIVPYDPLIRYIQEIKKYPKLTRAQEHRLAVRFWKYKVN
jgi:hypothetical protein